MHSRRILITALSAWVGLVQAQFPPPLKGVTVLESHVENGARISYKEVCDSMTSEQELHTDCPTE